MALRPSPQRCTNPRMAEATGAALAVVVVAVVEEAEAVVRWAAAVGQVLLEAAAVEVAVERCTRRRRHKTMADYRSTHCTTQGTGPRLS